MPRDSQATSLSMSPSLHPNWQVPERPGHGAPCADRLHLRAPHTVAASIILRDRVTQGLATVQMTPLPRSREEGRLQKRADLGSNLCHATHRLYDLELVADPLWVFSLSFIK